MGCIIMAVIVFLIIDLVIDFPQNILDFTGDGFVDFLSVMLTLAVGLEFVKMLCKHMPETIIEVLLFATARQMVVEHLSPIDTLISAFAIAILFAIRKYLFLRPEIKKTTESEPEQDVV